MFGTPIGLSNPGFRTFNPFAHRAHSQHAPSPVRVGNTPLGVPQQAADNKAGHAVNSRVISALNNALETQGAPPLSKLNPDDYTPQAVSDRILSFIDTALSNAKARGASDEKLQAMTEQARAGVEKGFAEAKDYLGQVGAINDDIMQNIDDTYSRIMKGLDSRQQALEDAGAASAAAVTSAYQAASFDRQETYDLEIKTAEGDVATIHIGRSYGASMSQGYAMSGNGYAFEATQANYAGIDVQYSVSGDLNEEERKAIGDLMSKVNDVADKFFAGDLASAFDSANALELDGSQLDSFALDLRSSEVRQATAAYETVANYTDEPIQLDPSNDYSAPDATDPLSAVKDFMKSLKTLFDGIDHLNNNFHKPEKMGKDLLDKRLLADPRSESTFGKLEDEANTAISGLTEKMIDFLRALQQPKTEPTATDVLPAAA